MSTRIEYHRLWRQNNPDKVRAALKRARTKWPLYQSARRYGLTMAELDAMINKQNGLCFICGKPETTKQKEGVRLLSMDHNHKTGDLRKLLCNRCNQGLGYLGDSVELTAAASSYLAKYDEYTQNMGLCY